MVCDCILTITSLDVLLGSLSLPGLEGWREREKEWEEEGRKNLTLLRWKGRFSNTNLRSENFCQRLTECSSHHQSKHQQRFRQITFLSNYEADEVWSMSHCKLTKPKNLLKTTSHHL